jgi:hypothetical protein
MLAQLQESDWPANSPLENFPALTAYPVTSAPKQARRSPYMIPHFTVLPELTIAHFGKFW